MKNNPKTEVIEKLLSRKHKDLDEVIPEILLKKIIELLSQSCRG